MKRSILTLTVATYLVACSSLVIADESNADSIKQEIRDIKRLVSTLNKRVQQLEERITSAASKTKTHKSRDADSMWQVFGVRLEQMKREHLSRKNNRYRGGMKVVAVRPEGPAERQGIQSGDILVGLHVWETTNKDDVDFIVSSDAIRQNKTVKFYVLREGHALFGHVQLQQPD